MTDLVQTFWRSEAVETASNRAYWTSRPWVSKRRDEVRDADILLLPWVGFSEEGAAEFPKGTTEFYQDLREALKNLTVEIAVDKDQYNVLALHSFELRWPTMLVNASLLTIFLGVVSTRIDALLFEHGAETPMRIEVIVEGDRGRCISVRYEGPARDFPEELLRQTERCLPKIASTPDDVASIGTKNPSSSVKTGGE